jgi:hypothetical protein
MTDIQKLLQQLRTNDSASHIKELVLNNPNPFLEILKEARELRTIPRFDIFRISVYKIVESILSRTPDGTDGKPILFTWEKGKMPFIEGAHIYIGTFVNGTLDFEGISYEKLTPEECGQAGAFEASQKRIKERHETRKQDATNIIAQAIYDIVIDERVEGQQRENGKITLGEIVKSVMTSGRRIEFRDHKKVLELAAELDKAGIKPKVQFWGKTSHLPIDSLATYSEVAKNKKHCLYKRLFDPRGTLARYV